VIISNPNFLIYSTVSKVTWDPCPSKMSKCPFVKNIPIGIDLSKKKNYLKMKIIIHAFDCIAIQVPSL
jgi:hypothetical protein